VGALISIRLAPSPPVSTLWAPVSAQSPVLLSLTPAQGTPGAAITVSATGLNADAALNRFFFVANTTSGFVDVPFESVDPGLTSGVVRVPEGARSGATGLRVNGVDASGSIAFYVPGPLAKCGNLLDLDFFATGAALMTYSAGPSEPGCPALTGSTAVAYQYPNGPVVLLRQGINTGTREAILAQAVTRDGASAYALVRVGNSSPFTWRVYQFDVQADSTIAQVTSYTISGLSPFFSAIQGSPDFSMDMGTDGDLYFTSPGPLGTQLTRVSLASLPLFQATFLGPAIPGFAPYLTTGCDGFAYIASHTESSTPPNFVDATIRKVSLQTGAVVAASPLIPNRLLTDLAFSCRTDELLVAMSSTTVGAIHTEVGAVQISEGALSPPAIFTTERFTNDDTILAVTPDGRLLVSQVLSGAGIATGRSMFEAGYQLSGCGGSFLPVCSRDEIEIIPETTRWKAQLSDEPMRVVFEGPEELDLASVRLDVVAPSEIGDYAPTLGGVARVAGSTNQYAFDWTGPWTYPMDNAGTTMQVRLPHGNYRLKVRGRRAATSPEIVSEEYGKVSLVTVTAVELREHLPGTLDGNPNTGGGIRIFPEATAPGGGIGERDLATVLVTTEPEITDPGPEPVRVFVRAIDVDDPSASGDEVDDETSVEDKPGGWRGRSRARAPLYAWERRHGRDGPRRSRFESRGGGDSPRFEAAGRQLPGGRRDERR
jgi:hypothetical protein